MAEEPDLDMAMTRLLAEIAGVLNKAAGRPADPAMRLLQLPSKLTAQHMFGSRRRVMLSFERQPFPRACHVDQDVPHS
jgi:hypothetical protein